VFSRKDLITAWTAASAAAVAASVAALRAIFCMRTALDLAASNIDRWLPRADRLFLFAMRESPDTIVAGWECGS